MKFVSDDGKFFDTMEECEEYEKMNNEGREIAQLWKNNITTYDGTGDIIESSYDFKKDIKSYLEDTADIVVKDVIFIHIASTSGEWGKIKTYLYQEYGLILPSYTRGLWRYDNNTQHWISFHNEYEEFKEKWAPMGIRF